MADKERLRAPFQWFGGKGNMLANLLPLIPAGGRPYCEPYAGAASVFFARDPAPVEVINDLDDRIVNLFRVLQDREQFEELKHRIMWTPYARAEFGRALDILRNGSDDPVERAWAFFVAMNQGFSGTASTISNWGRAFVSAGGMAKTTNKWVMRQTMMDAWRWRLMHCQIDNRDALEVIRYWDNPDAVFYVDPPYHPDTRTNNADYAIEQGHDHHAALVETILGCKGAVVLSGYDHPVYQPLVDAGWEVTRFETVCYAAAKTRGSGLQGKGALKAKAPRTEVVWRNPRAVELTSGITRELPLFAHANGTHDTGAT
ncbi:MAG: hypothetical protein KatS3mg038_2519 [Candidatus Kapaibacterium sp.]|nr:MAG: hypothetical protein KatS3mg038_2519 [Candidatus Kapabacteria bacterium]